MPRRQAPGRKFRQACAGVSERQRPQRPRVFLASVGRRKARGGFLVCGAHPRRKFSEHDPRSGQLLLYCRHGVDSSQQCQVDGARTPPARITKKQSGDGSAAKLAEPPEDAHTDVVRIPVLVNHKPVKKGGRVDVPP